MAILKASNSFPEMRVEISSSINLLMSCYAHSTETEEVACILLGNITNEIATVSQVVFSVRKDKRKDRVEISSEQLSMAMTEAEALGLRVVGWM